MSQLLSVIYSVCDYSSTQITDASKKKSASFSQRQYGLKYIYMISI